MVDQVAQSGSLGAGQQDPFTPNSDFTVTAFIVSQMMARLDTMKLVKVTKVTGGGGAIAAAGTVDVQPLVSQIDGAGNTTPHGTVSNIPWFRLQGGKSAIICDPVVGDIGYVSCADRDISNVKSAKAVSPPGSRRKYNIADGIYVGAVLVEAPEQYLVFTPGGGFKLLDKFGNSIEGKTSGLVLTDKTGNVVEMSAAGIAMTPHGSLPVTVNGVLVVNGGMQLSGLIAAIGGGTYAGNITTSGTIQGGIVRTATVTMDAHIHAANNTPPTPGH